MEGEKETYISPEETPIVKDTLMFITECLEQNLDLQKKALKDGDIEEALRLNEETYKKGEELFDEVSKLKKFCDPPWDDNYWEW